jgi:hypothetical protein
LGAYPIAEVPHGHIEDIRRTLAMNDFCELIELTASELDEVAGGRVSISHSGNHSGNTTDVSVVKVHVNIENNAETEIKNNVNNSINL